MKSWNCPLEHDGRKKHVEMYCRGKHNQLHIPNNSAPPPETKHDLQEVTGKNKASTPSPAGAVTTHDCPAFVAAQGNLCGCQITMASVYAPVERQERAPFFQHSLMPALPAGTPLALGGDWNCVAGDQDLVGGQPGTRQSGFHSGLLPLQG